MSKSLRTTDLLEGLKSVPSVRIGVHEIVEALSGRAFALLIVLLGLPNCLPMPPPIPTICGILLILVSLQMMSGMITPWMPRRILSQTVSRLDLVRAVDRALPLLRRLERVSRPRLGVADGGLALRLVGATIFVLSVALLVAAPFVGQIPLGIAISVIGVGLVERDGLLMIWGAAIGVVGLAITAGFVWTLVAAVNALG